MHLPNHLLKEFLDDKYDLYNRPEFIDSDPIQIPHQFNLTEDIEIAALLTATIAWGQRKSIINNANKLMKLMGNNPYDFMINAGPDRLKKLEHFVHRTFQGEDCIFFLRSLQNIYQNKGGLKAVFEDCYAKEPDMVNVLINFRNIFFEIEGPLRTRKHVSDVSKNASAKRLNMFLRWMVRVDKRGVDFGIWQGIPASALYIPLDLHSGNIARKLGLLKRQQNDWKAVAELTERLREFDPSDPVKYDFALFGLGVNDDF
jgi:uncharacterized protein (TIGR02757 family)